MVELVKHQLALMNNSNVNVMLGSEVFNLSVDVVNHSLNNNSLGSGEGSDLLDKFLNSGGESSDSSSTSTLSLSDTLVSACCSAAAFAASSRLVWHKLRIGD